MRLATLDHEYQRIEGREISTLMQNEVKYTVSTEGKKYRYLVHTRISEIFMVLG